MEKEKLIQRLENIKMALKNGYKHSGINKLDNLIDELNSLPRVEVSSVSENECQVKPCSYTDISCGDYVDEDDCKSCLHHPDFMQGD